MLLNVLRCRLTYYGQAETNAVAWFNIALRPRKPVGSLGRTAQDGHLDSHTAPELCCVQKKQKQKQTFLDPSSDVKVWWGFVLLFCFIVLFSCFVVMGEGRGGGGGGVAGGDLGSIAC